MDIEKATTEVSGFLKEDTPESVKTQLESVKREFETMQISLKSANEESKGRKEKIRKLQDEFDDAQSQISKLSDDTKMKEMKVDHDKQIGEYKTLNEQLLESQKQLHGIFRTEFTNDLSQIKDHPNFEKVKDILKLPELKDDKYDFSTLSDEDMLYNKTKLSEYKTLGLFEMEGNKMILPKVPLTQKIIDVDIVELAKTNFKEAKKILDKKRGRNVLFK